jgi:hypothetical protein
MTFKRIGITLLLTFGVYGCGGPAAGPQGDADHWLSKVPAGSSEQQARQVLADNNVSNWSTGRVMYGYRDKVASCDYSDGVAVQVNTDPEGRVTSSAALGSPVSPFPMIAPTYP